MKDSLFQAMIDADLACDQTIGKEIYSSDTLYESSIAGDRYYVEHLAPEWTRIRGEFIPEMRGGMLAP